MRQNLLYLDFRDHWSSTKTSTPTAPSHRNGPTRIIKIQEDDSQHTKDSRPGLKPKATKNNISADLVTHSSKMEQTTSPETVNKHHRKSHVPFAVNCPVLLYSFALLAISQLVDGSAFDPQDAESPVLSNARALRQPLVSSTEAPTDWLSISRLLAAIYIGLMAIRFGDLVRIARSPIHTDNPSALSAYLLASALVAPVAWVVTATDPETSRSDTFLVGSCNVITCLNLDASLWVNLAPIRWKQTRLLLAMVLARGSWLMACVCLKQPAAIDDVSRYFYQPLLGTSFLATNLMSLGVWLWLSSTSAASASSGSPV